MGFQRVDPVFTREDFNKPYGNEKTKIDQASGREISHTFSPAGGHFLQVSGEGVPGLITITCDGEMVNVLARVLLDATFDERLVE